MSDKESPLTRVKIGSGQRETGKDATMKAEMDNDTVSYYIMKKYWNTICNYIKRTRSVFQNVMLILKGSQMQ